MQLNSLLSPSNSPSVVADCISNPCVYVRPIQYSPQSPVTPVTSPSPHPYDTSSQNGHQAQYHHTFPGAHRHRHGTSRGLNYDRPAVSGSRMDTLRSVPDTYLQKEFRALQASRSAF